MNGDFRQDWDALRSAIGSVIVGQDEVVEQTLTCLFAGGHALLEGVPGLGKTLLVRSIADAIDVQFSRIQFTPDLMPADVTGTTIVEEDSDGRRFVFRKGPIFAQIVLADEINRATPKTQSALLEAMQERSVTAGGETRLLDPPFLVLATQNPVEQEGTYPLPEAQLDRFLLKVLVPAPDAATLAEILDRTTGVSQPSASQVLTADQVIAHQAAVRAVEVPPSARDDAVRLVMATRPEDPSAPPRIGRYLRFGASPRAAQALILAAKVTALRHGRTAVTSADVRSHVLPALRHRVATTYEAHAEGLTPDALLADVVEMVPATV
ncbi:MAG: AAA family ATPase [Phycisphaerales bacterium]|nr:AAA family ATPase [Phycisphaerales bacterium]